MKEYNKMQYSFSRRFGTTTIQIFKESPNDDFGILCTHMWFVNHEIELDDRR